MKKLAIFAILWALAISLPLATAQAATAQAGAVHVTADQIISGNLYVTGQSVTIDGVVSGDLIAATKSVVINGQVAGDVIAVSETLIVDGVVEGNVRAISQDIQINGSVSRNISALGSTILLGSSSFTGWDAYLAANKIESRGKIDGSLNGWSNRITVAGQINKDLNISAPASKKPSVIKIEPSASVLGDVNYSSLESLEIAESATVSGSINHSIPENKTAKLWGVIWLIKETILIFSALIVGLALIYLARNWANKIIDELEGSPLKAFLAGLWLFITIPLISLLLALTIIGLPFSLIIIALWLMAMYCGKILLAILLGKLIFSKIFRVKKDAGLFWPLIIGVAVLWLLTSLPVIGWLISLIAACLGLGGIWNYVNHKQ